MADRLEELTSKLTTLSRDHYVAVAVLERAIAAENRRYDTARSALAEEYKDVVDLLESDDGDNNGG